MRGTTELSNLDLGCGGSRRLSPHLFPPLVEINELIRSDYHEKRARPWPRPRSKAENHSLWGHPWAAWSAIENAKRRSHVGP